MGTDAKLTIKSKLLLNKVNMSRSIVLDITADEEKRVKNLNKVFGVCDTVFSPFYKGESKEFLKSMGKGEQKAYKNLVTLISENKSVAHHLNELIDVLTKCLQTRKLDLLKLQDMWVVISKE